MDWAKEKGIISDSDRLGAFISMKEAADVVEKFIRVLEKESELTFTALKNVSGGKDIGKAIGYISDTTYNNASITRYDVAEICYAIAKLSVE